MRPLDLQSENFNPTGNLAGRGVLNQLGRPNIDFLTLTLREAVQNSWDARVSDDLPVQFSVVSWLLNERQTLEVKEKFFRELPPNLRLTTALPNAKTVRVLAFSDRRTTGLGGPTRADLPPEDGERKDFVGFLRNIGQPSNQVQRGGTYGYGKASFFLLSRFNTVIVDTMCISRGLRERRLMGAALGESYDIVDPGPSETSGSFTGRHWWGRERNRLVDPLINGGAESVAESLGLPNYCDNECGTTILVLDPDFGSMEPYAAMEHLASGISWNFWPKMISRGALPPQMNFAVILDRQPISIPDPEITSPLSEFVAALRALDGTGRVADALGTPLNRSIEVLNPKQHLGQLVAHKTATFGNQGWLNQGYAPGAPSDGYCHHIAFMRAPRLIVRYLEGPKVPLDHVGYAGVFVVDDSVDHIFANSEPPAHEDWVEKQLAHPHHRTFVRVGKRRIIESIREWLDTTRPAQHASLQQPTAAFAQALGHLLPGAEGPGAGVRSADVNANPRGRAAARNLPTANISDMPTPDFIGDTPVVKFPLEIAHARGTHWTRVRPTAVIVLDNGALEKDPPLGSDVPMILGWIDQSGVLQPAKEEIWIAAELSVSTCIVLVSLIPDAAVGLLLECEAVAK